MTSYTYCVFETDKGREGLMYIGSRKCPRGKTPENDSYMGSPKSKKNQDFKSNPNKDKIILATFETHEEALAHEIELHEILDVVRSPRFANQAKQTSTGFSTEGRKGENCPAYGRTGEKNPMFGRVGEKGPMHGKRVLTNGREVKVFATGEEIPEGWFGASRDKISGSHHYRCSLERYSWFNEGLNTLEESLTCNEMGKKHRLKSSHLFRIIRGECKSCKGWTLLP